MADDLSIFINANEEIAVLHEIERYMGSLDIWVLGHYSVFAKNASKLTLTELFSL
jgi:hypothetical protein